MEQGEKPKPKPMTAARFMELRRESERRKVISTPFLKDEDDDAFEADQRAYVQVERRRAQHVTKEPPQRRAKSQLSPEKLQERQLLIDQKGLEEGMEVTYYERVVVGVKSKYGTRVKELVPRQCVLRRISAANLLHLQRVHTKGWHLNVHPRLVERAIKE